MYIYKRSNIFIPKNPSETIRNFFVYFGILLTALTLYHLIDTVVHLNDKGTYVVKPNCIDSETDYDDNGSYTYCVEYGEPKIIPVGVDIKNNFVKDSIISFAICCVVYFLQKSKLEKTANEFRRKIAKVLKVKDEYSIEEVAQYYERSAQEVKKYMDKEGFCYTEKNNQQLVNFYEWLDREYWMSINSSW